MDRNKLASLKATLVWNYDRPSDSLTRVKSRATSVAKKHIIDARRPHFYGSNAMQLYYACIVSHLWSVNHSRPGKNCLDKYNHNLVKTIPLAIAFRFCVRAWNIAVTLQTGTSSPFICQDLTSSFQTAQSADSFQRTLIANICSLEKSRQIGFQSFSE